jgi:hypothetical protein
MEERMNKRGAGVCMAIILGGFAASAVPAKRAPEAAMVAPRHQSLPADCSNATVPDEPAQVSINGVAFAPSVAIEGAEGPSLNGVEYDEYDLHFIAPGSELRWISLTVYPLKGQSLEGIVLRLPDERGDFSKPVILFEDQAADIEFGAAEMPSPASMQIRFGKWRGKTISGSIYLCGPKGAVTEKSQKIVHDSYAIGNFEAKMK